MKFYVTLLLFLFNSYFGLGQDADSLNTQIEQRLEMISELSEDDVAGERIDIPVTNSLQPGSVDINSAGPDEMLRLPGVEPIHVHALIAYRQVFGPLLNIYELQAVPGWDVVLCRKIQLYVYVSSSALRRFTWKEKVSAGSHALLIRVSQVLQKSEGYKQDSAGLGYPGSPHRALVKYGYTFRDMLQVGLQMEKDAGEPWISGRAAYLPDFISGHILVGGHRFLKRLVLGDYTIRWGQGLLCWQGLSQGKTADVGLLKRQAAELRPYQSFAEQGFFRGIAANFINRSFESTVFFSNKKIDANIVADSMMPNGKGISSFQSSGLHRTNAELEDKGSVREMVAGISLKYTKNKRFMMGASTIITTLSVPVMQKSDPYRYLNFRGKKLLNHGIHYAYIIRNTHFFGEFAMANPGKFATLHGLMINTSSKTEAGLVFRAISPEYKAFHASSVTENSEVANETGLLVNLNLRPGRGWTLSSYIDIFRFPWLRYQVNGPCTGSEAYIKLLYKPARETEYYISFRKKSKELNISDGRLDFPGFQHQHNIRVHMEFKAGNKFSLRQRLELVWLKAAGEMKPGQGIMIYTDVIYKPLVSKISGNLRVMIFETDGYPTRVYAYENDVLYGYSIPAVFGKGIRHYLNLRFKMSKHMSIWLKWADTFLFNSKSIGSGKDEILGNSKSEVKLQAAYTF